MKKVITKDGSMTYHNEECDECYHSKTGAIEESFKKFAELSNLKPGAVVLDICFGIGYNSLAAIHLCKPIKIIALENDQKIIDKIQEVEVADELKEDYEYIKKASLESEFKSGDGEVQIKLLMGDARETVKQVTEKVDAVFLDPFSPKKCPELWTEEFFKDIFDVMKDNAILTTYSCARVVRDNLEKAGFTVKDGPSVGRRSPSTIAMKNPV